MNINVRNLSRLISFAPREGNLFPDKRNHDPLHEKLTCRHQIRIHRVLGFEVGPSVIRDVTFERRFSVDQGRDNVSALDLLSVLQDDDVAIQDMRVDHGISANTERKSAGVF